MYVCVRRLFSQFTDPGSGSPTPVLNLKLFLIYRKDGRSLSRASSPLDSVCFGDSGQPKMEAHCGQAVGILTIIMSHIDKRAISPISKQAFSTLLTLTVLILDSNRFCFFPKSGRY